MTRRKVKSTSPMLDAAKLIERGITLVYIRLPWGQVEWRASNETMHGRSLQGLPVSITGINRDALLLWLKGTTTKRAFPTMGAFDQELLETGYCNEDLR